MFDDEFIGNIANFLTKETTDTEDESDGSCGRGRHPPNLNDAQ
jgi:hypothetical protein